MANAGAAADEAAVQSPPMAHPKMFDDDDPIFGRVRSLALALPGADMKVSHGRPAFFTTKIFAYYGCSTRDDGEWTQHPTTLVIQPDPEDRLALDDDPRVIVPAYLGPSGWRAVELDPSGSRAGSDRDTDWDEVVELLDASYRQTAPKTLIRELDQR